MDFSKYDNSVPYPTKPKIIICGNKKCKKEYPTSTFKDGTFNYCSHCGYDIRSVFHAEMRIYESIKKAYDTEEDERHQRFRDDLLAEFDLTNHPKKDNIYSYVWEQGHSGGFSEVYYALHELMEYDII